MTDFGPIFVDSCSPIQTALFLGRCFAMQTKAFSEFESAFLKIAFGEVFPNFFMIKSLFFKAINSIQIPFAKIALILQLMWRIIIV